MEASSAGYNVVPVSGSSAVLNALVASGLTAQPFLFVGFLPSTASECRKKLREYRAYPMTMVFYEAPHRIARMLECLQDVLGDRRICIAREMTKIHEEFIRGKISEVRKEADSLKGEMVVVVEGNRDDYEKDIDYGEIMHMVEEYIEQGISRSEAIRETAKRTGISTNKIYDLVHEKGRQVKSC